MKRVAAALAWFEARWEGLLGAGNNPFHQLGALCIYCFWIALVTGIYLFVFYRTSIEGSWESVEQLTREQWYVGGVMRSLHRYASDAAVLFMLGHLEHHLGNGIHRRGTLALRRFYFFGFAACVLLGGRYLLWIPGAQSRNGHGVLGQRVAADIDGAQIRR